MEDIFVGIWFLFVLTMTFLPIMCLIHVITHQFRNLKTKFLWIFVIVLIPYLGPILYYLKGRNMVINN